ncbi:hypothetical protein LIER_13505 [Lithospermum erythrorhizon]|uniref:Aminotransferase-like plant mobile domain-containing protein n=1 Tax=Lithospermum erythrorhizon TaxID=34254 RepID=A0AAV3PY61_LITER
MLLSGSLGSSFRSYLPLYLSLWRETPMVSKVTMVSFFTEEEHPSLHLCIHDQEDDEDTIMAVHPPLYKGSWSPWEALDAKTDGGDVATKKWSWHSWIALHGLFEYTPGYWECTEDILSRCSTKHSTADIYEVVRASLYICEYSDPLMKAFMECWSPSSNTLLLPYESSPFLCGICTSWVIFP